MVDVIYYLIVFLGVASITLYSCWLFFHRLKHGEDKRKNFLEWLKNILQAFWGI